MDSSWSLGVWGDTNNKSVTTSPTTNTAILKLSRIVRDTSLSFDVVGARKLLEFQLGDEIACFSPNWETHENNYSSQNYLGENYFYIVCTGKVRLLGFDSFKKRDVSTGLVLPQETFGGDDLFCSRTLAYKAVAASNVKVVRLTIDELNFYFQQIPQLQEDLQKIIFRRQAILFWKTCTELRSQKSQTLQHLSEYLESIKIDAGSNLQEIASAKQGRFWLLDGKVHTITAEILPVPKFGESWGCPDTTPAEWLAQTDLLVYHLSQTNWETFNSLEPRVKSQESRVKSQEPRVKSQESKVITPPSPPPPLFSQTPFIQQQSASDCGAACLAMVCQYWGKRFSINTLRNLTQVDRRGATFSGLADASESLGYHTLTVRGSLSKLEMQAHPWIAHWQGIHYVVVWRVKKNSVLISDPAIGKRKLLREEFEANWTGYALLLEPTQRLFAHKNEKISYTRWLSFFWQYPKLLLQIVLASVLLQLFGVATPIIAQITIDIVLPHRSNITLDILALGLLMFGAWRFCLVGVRQYLLDYIGKRMELTFTAGFIRHAIGLPLEFFASRHVGDIISRAAENQKIQQFFTQKAVSTILDTFTGVFYLALMAYYNLQLTLLAVGLTVPVIILTSSTSSLRKRFDQEAFTEKIAQNSAMVEIVTGISTIKAFSAQRQMRWRWEERFAAMLQAQFRSYKLANNLQLTNSLLEHIAKSLVLWFGATLIMQQELSLGQFFAFNMFVQNGVNPILGIIKLWDEFQDILISEERLNDVLSYQKSENPKKPLLTLSAIRGDIHFENVCFRYHPSQERNALQNISFQVQQGQTIAIVGPSGSGKSTLVSLLAGLYHPSSGSILIDGCDITSLSEQTLRMQLGVVPQECFLFSGTILENITLWSDEFTQQQAIAAASFAQAHQFIQALPLGYQTQVGHRGDNLSFGQRQKIAIARALILNPRILILDEATSGLDMESERHFQQNLSHFNRDGRTTFIVTHRLESIRHADQILVLDRGILIEQGTHEQLVENNGLYSYLIQQQQII